MYLVARVPAAKPGDADLVNFTALFDGLRAYFRAHVYAAGTAQRYAVIFFAV